MGTRIEKVMKNISSERRAKIKARTDELISEYMTLQKLRKAQDLTQKRLAKLLKVGQDSISRIESRNDMFLSTLQKYISAMGGDLKLLVEFPNKPPVILDGLLQKERNL